MRIAAEVETSSTKFDSAQKTLLPVEMNKVGQSVFYDCLDLSPTAEKQDDMKPERSDTEEESEHTISYRISSSSITIVFNSYIFFQCRKLIKMEPHSME